ncbi:hypothetical protein [Streptomyces sp. NBC_01429]|uniref:hypothetical protein n=1 Tax=Streptomyces sp. NBC_01429 TaxID=2903862 RepID=UPI002E2C6F01|nr:hypothetical protein [Streptomyces sp. NBC_01429]
MNPRAVRAKYRADAGHFPIRPVAIEAQGRRDDDKATSWAYYVAYLQAKYKLPVLLLVVCRDRSTATWAAGPFECGARGWTALSTHPLVLGPDNVPVITDASVAARDLGMAAFSAMTHSGSRDAPAILEALARALRATDVKSAEYYGDLLDIGLADSEDREKWRDMMTFVTHFPGRGTLREEAYLEGKAEAKAEAKVEARAEMVLRLLDLRALPVSDDIRARVTDCTDLATLDMWFERALNVAEAEALFTHAAPGADT